MKKSIFILFVNFLAFGLWAQSNCPTTITDIACLGTGDISDYKIIGNPNQSVDDEDLISADLLLDRGAAQSNSQLLIIIGEITFTDDYTFAANSELVFLECGSFYFDNLTLDLNGVSVHGCDGKVWPGIYGESVTGFAKISIKNSTISDAIEAIKLGPFSFLEASNSIFKRNWKSIVAIGTANAKVRTFGQGISNSQFYGNEMLPMQVAGNTHPIAAIEFSHALHFSFGSFGGENLITDYTSTSTDVVGIKASHSNVTVENTKFKNINGTNGGDFRGYGILYTEDSENNLLSVDGLDNTVDMFDNCDFSISSTGPNLHVSNVGMRTSDGIGVFDSRNKTIDILDNVIRTFGIDNDPNDPLQSEFFGIYIRESNPSTISIKDNRILCGGSSDKEYGIAAFEPIPCPAQNMKILNNEIRNLSASDEFNGIVVNSTVGTEIGENKVHLKGITIRTQYGLVLANADQAKLLNDTILGNSHNSISSHELAAGIYIRSSSRISLKCNYIDWIDGHPPIFRTGLAWN